MSSQGEGKSKGKAKNARFMIALGVEDGNDGGQDGLVPGDSGRIVPT